MNLNLNLIGRHYFFEMNLNLTLIVSHYFINMNLINPDPKPNWKALLHRDEREVLDAHRGGVPCPAVH